MRGINQRQVKSPHKRPVTRKCFHLMTSSWSVVTVNVKPFVVISISTIAGESCKALPNIIVVCNPLEPVIIHLKSKSVKGRLETRFNINTTMLTSKRPNRMTRSWFKYKCVLPVQIVVYDKTTLRPFCPCNEISYNGTTHLYTDVDTRTHSSIGECCWFLGLGLLRIFYVNASLLHTCIECVTFL